MSELPVIRVVYALGLRRSLRMAALVSLAVGMAWVLALALPLHWPPSSWVADAKYYYAAGDRLNSGHLLYAYSPGDRILAADPFAFAGPFLYPPLLGVLWRPLALLQFDAVIASWWALGLVIFVATLVVLVWRGGPWIATGTIALLPALVLTAWSGNVSTMVTPAIIGAWLLLTHRRDKTAGAVVGFLTVLKLTPAFLVWWFFATGRWPAVKSAVGAAGAAAVISIVGAGLSSLFDYASVSSEVATHGGTIGSITGILAGLGAPVFVLTLATPIVCLLGATAVWVARGNERLAWALAIGAGVLASPVLNVTNASLLLAGFVALDPSLTGGQIGSRPGASDASGTSSAGDSGPTGEAHQTAARYQTGNRLAAARIQGTGVKAGRM